MYLYHLPDVLRTECYQAIIQISKELCIAKEYLGNGLFELGLSAPLKVEACYLPKYKNNVKLYIVKLINNNAYLYTDYTQAVFAVRS